MRIGYKCQIIILKSKRQKMKKLFAIALIAVSFAACNSAETKTEEAVTDSAAAIVDSAASAAAATVDSTASAAAAKVDSTAKAVTDTLKK